MAKREAVRMRGGTVANLYIIPLTNPKLQTWVSGFQRWPRRSAALTAATVPNTVCSGDQAAI
jgi:hypothetical protein